MKSALVHYWLVTRRGGEAVLEAIGELLPEADLFAHVIDQDVLFGSLKGRRTQETFIGRLPFARRRYQMYLPLMPLGLESLDMSDYDLIVSSEAGPAKWVVPHPNARHICYSHSPLRYIWDQRHTYFSGMPGPLKVLAHATASRLRTSDVISATRVDQFVANSNFVAKRIWKYYRREADVVFPPVEVNEFTPVNDVDDYYLFVGDLRFYKRVDLAIQACTALNRRLVVIGAGKERKQLEKLAGPTVEFRGKVPFPELKQALARCRALLFPGIEDFGISIVEAMASGRPVIAYNKGGAVDSVLHGESGLLYSDPSLDGVKQAILEFESEEQSFRPEACVARAREFGRDRFLERFAVHLKG